MNDFLRKLTGLKHGAVILATRLARAIKRAAVWLSPPRRLCVAGIVLAFLVSFVAWAAFDRSYDSLLFFPEAQGNALRGEVRALPRGFTTERRAELIASDFLLGPMRPGLKPAFEGRVEVSSVLYRKGSLYLDLSEDAALEAPAALVLGLEALRRSLSAGLPGVSRIVLTIGGMEPYAEGSANDGQAAKKNKKN